MKKKEWIKIGAVIGIICILSVNLYAVAATPTDGMNIGKAEVKNLVGASIHWILGAIAILTMIVLPGDAWTRVRNGVFCDAGMEIAYMIIDGISGIGA